MIINKFANVKDDEYEYKEKLKMNQGFHFTEKDFLGTLKENIFLDVPIFHDPPLSMINMLIQFGPTTITRNLEDVTKVNNILGLMKDDKMGKLKKFLKNNRSSKESIKILDNIMNWNGTFVNHITFIKKCVYLFSRVFPNIIINGVVQNNLIHTYWDLSKTHSEKISTFCVKYYEPFEKFRMKINPLLEKVIDETKDIYELSINAPFMEEYTTLLLNINYLLDVLNVYIIV